MRFSSSLHHHRVGRPGRRWFLLAIAAAWAVVLLHPVTARSAGWTTVTNPPVTNTSISPVQDLAWDGSTLWMVWGTETFDVLVSGWNGTSWTSPYPAVVSGVGTKNKMPSIAWDGSKLWVAYNDGSHIMKVVYWGGASWVAVPDIGVSGGAEYSTPDIYYGGGNLYAARQDASRVVNVVRWNGASWTALGSPGSGTINTYPNLAWDGSNLWAAWSSASGVTSISKLVGATWTPQMTYTNPDGTSANLATIFFIGSRLYLAHDTIDGATLAWWDGAQFRAAPAMATGQTVYGYADVEWTGTRLWGAWGADPMITRVGYADPVAPNAPSALGQFEADAVTAITAGAWTRFGAATAAVLKATASSSAPAEVLTPWTEVRPNAAAFANTCGQVVAGSSWSGTPVSAPTAGVGVAVPGSVTGLTNGNAYAWRRCVVGAWGFPGAWTALGGAPDLRIDTTTPTAAPTAPANAATGVSTTPTLAATYTDPAPATTGRVDFDLCSDATCATVVQSGFTAGVASAAGATWAPTTLLQGTVYYWRAKATDSANNASGWSAIRSFTTAPPALSINVDAATVDQGGVALGDTVSVVTASITSDDPDGYTLLATDANDSWGMTCTCGSTIPDWTGTDVAPSVWGAAAGGAGGYVGVSVLDTTGVLDARLAKWGTANPAGWPTVDVTNNRYTGLRSSTSTTLHQVGSVAGADTVRVAWRTTPAASTPPGSYVGSVQLTVLGRP